MMSQHATEYESSRTNIRSLVVELDTYGLHVLHLTERTCAPCHHGTALSRLANGRKVSYGLQRNDS
jgi:hypothetical protein